MSEVTNAQFMEALARRPQHELMMSTLDMITSTTDLQRDLPAASSPMDMLAQLAIINKNISVINANLLGLGGLQHYFEEGDRRQPATFLRWAGPASGAEPDQQSWTVISPDGGSYDVTVQNSVIDEMRESATPGLPPVPTAFTFGIDQVFGNPNRSRRPRRTAQTIIDEFIARQQPFSPSSGS
ncbi:MAG TPA: hypothetical protein VHB51_03710 [Candidatus Saccharimonadales bacterium]|nr:hypothetical protein [Candidatus Saccharimonadales bacterium]